MNKKVIVVEDFYDNPHEVRKYALGCNYYPPYGDGFGGGDGQGNTEEWLSTSPSQRYITDENISKLEDILNIKIDLEHFHNSTENNSLSDNGTKWNAGFQVKMQPEGSGGAKGIHCHVYDGWNHVGPNGWAGVVFLTPDNMSYEHNGLDTWWNVDGLQWWNSQQLRNTPWVIDFVDCPTEKPNQPAPYISQNKDWKLSSRIQYKFNTLVLTRGDVYHAGSNGWGDSIENGRMIQTFFFKEKDES